MPLTGAERSKRFRERVKLTNPEKYNYLKSSGTARSKKWKAKMIADPEKRRDQLTKLSIKKNPEVSTADSDVHNYNRQSYKKISPIIRAKQSLMLNHKLRQLRRKRETEMGFNLIHKNLQVEEHEKDIVEDIKVESLDPELEPNEDVLDHDSSPPRSPEKSNDFSNNFNDDDPLSMMLNYSSRNDSTIMENKGNTEKEIHPSDDKELIKLQIELCKYQLENAKLERKRIEQRIADESIESALRVRAARLEAIAAARKLPPHHPALRYSSLEDRAQPYLEQFHSK